MPNHSLAAAGVTARIKSHGGELCSLTAPDGTELIWQAHPAWPRHSPILFPIVGTLRDNRYRHAGKTYELGRHGFAREAQFDWVARSASTAHLVLVSNPATRAVYPFEFRFEVFYALGSDGLTSTYRITNTGESVLPASMGAHPAFNWPLRPGIAKTDHRLEFASPEPAPIRRIRRDGLLRPDPLPTPVEGSTLALHDGLFAEDAIIFDHPVSTSVRFTTPGAPVVEVSWQGFTELGIWNPVGVDLLCIEPWYGVSDPIDYDGDLMGKPFIHHIAPGASLAASHSIRVIQA